MCINSLGTVNNWELTVLNLKVRFLFLAQSDSESPSSWMTWSGEESVPLQRTQAYLYSKSRNLVLLRLDLCMNPQREVSWMEKRNRLRRPVPRFILLVLMLAGFLGMSSSWTVWYVLAWHAGLRTGPGEAVCPISCLDQGAVRDRLQLACVVHRMLLVPGSLSLCTAAVAGCSMWLTSCVARTVVRWAVRTSGCDWLCEKKNRHCINRTHLGMMPFTLKLVQILNNPDCWGSQFLKRKRPSVQCVGS